MSGLVNVLNWIEQNKYEVEAVIFGLFIILLICLIVRAVTGRNRKDFKRIDQKLEELRSAVADIKDEQARDTYNPPISISADGKEVHIAIGSSADENNLIKPADAEPQTDIEPELIVEPGTDAGHEQAAEPAPIIELEPEPNIEIEPERVIIPEPQPDVESEPVVKPEPAAEPVQTAGQESEPEPEPELNIEIEPERVIIPEPQPDVEPEPVVEPEPAAEPVQTAEPESEPEPGPEPAPEVKLTELDLDLENRDEIDLCFESGVEPVVNIFTDNACGFEPGEHVLSLQDDETQEFLLAEEDLIKILAPEKQAAEPEIEAAVEEGPQPEAEAVSEPETESGDAAAPEAESTQWTVPGWRELGEVLDIEFEPIHTIELAFDTPSGSESPFEEMQTSKTEAAFEDNIEIPLTYSGRRSTEAVRESYEASAMRGRLNDDAPVRAGLGFATDKHGNTYTEQSLMDQIK